MERKEIIRWLMLAAILFAIIMQIRVYSMLKTKAQLMEEPAMYMAKVYNIDYCECVMFEDETTTQTILFNKTSSIIKTQKGKGTGINYSIKIDWDKLLGDTNEKQKM